MNDLTYGLIVCHFPFLTAQLRACDAFFPQDYISFEDEGAKGGAVRNAAQRVAAFNPFRFGGKRSEDGTAQGSGAPSYFEAVHSSDCVMQASKNIRMGFLRKVYGILSIQLAVTAAVCAIAMKATNPTSVNGYHTLSLGSFLAGNQMFYLFTFLISITILLFLFCVRQTYPMNVILLGFWTFAMAFSIATACVMAVCDPLVTPVGSTNAPTPLSLSTGSGPLALAGGVYQCAVETPYAEYGSNATVLAAGMTAGLFLALTLFTIQSKIDFSFLGAGLFASVWILIIWSICMSFWGGSPAMQYWYALIGAVIFSLYIVFDTWLIANKMGPDDYIAATINLYLDIVNLFLMLLQLLRRD